MKEKSISIEDVLSDLRCQGELDLHVINIGSLEFICRPLSYQEYMISHSILNTIDELEAHEFIVKVCVLYPYKESLKTWIDNSGTNCDKLANLIIAYSNFNSKEAIANSYDEAKESCETDFMAAVQIYISKSLGISPLELEKLSLKKTMDLLVKAEFVTEIPMNVKEILGLEEQKDPGIQLPIAPGMQTTDLAMTKEFMLDPRNASTVPPEAFR